MTAPAPASGASSVPARGPWFVAALLLLVFAQVAIMAAKAPSAVNPDEELHFVTAQYYHNHWLPPPATDPEVVRYLDPRYGTSYLLASPPQILYPLAAKAALLAGGEPHFRRGLRLFNLGLLCALVGAGSILARRNRWPAFFLLLTPQLWYSFSYFNGDAFAFFLAVFIALAIGLPHSRFRAYLEAAAPDARVTAAIPVALGLGLLVLAKHNYFIFLMGAAAFSLVLAWRADVTTGRRKRLKRWLLVVVLTGLVPLPFLVRDSVINGFDKAAIKAQLREAHARPEYKPSRIHEPGSNPGLALRAKGVGLGEVLGPMRWPRRFFRSFTGVYGPMTVIAPPAYYIAQGILYAALAAAGAGLLRKRAWSEKLLVLLTILFIGGMLFDAVLFSWLYDFQAQGRYLFPAIPLLLLLVLTLNGRRPISPPLVLLAALFALGTWSFVFVGLKNLIP